MAWTLDNLPYGSMVDADGRRFAAVRHGDDVVELTALDRELFGDGSLDALLAAGPATWAQVRSAVRSAVDAGRLPSMPLREVRPVLGFTVADYVDFYTSRDHAANGAAILRPGSSPLPPAWPTLPIGYHGRAQSVGIAPAELARPWGITGPDRYGPTQALDLEAEVAFVIGVGSTPGVPVTVDEADAHVFGICLLNDWSARDVQRFESAPLGPFLGKSFATSIGAWITPLAALDAARIPLRDDEPLRPVHLRDTAPRGLDLELAIELNGEVVSRPRFAAMSWSYAQLVAHLTSNGSALRTGDVLASGTVSGPTRDRRGCLLELAWGGTEPLVLADGSSRSWLEDGDQVVVSGHAGSVTLGEIRSRIVGTPRTSLRREPR